MFHEFVISDPQILDGAPVFAGTTVPVEALMKYRQGDTPVYEFLVDHPAVDPAHAKWFARWLAAQDAQTVRAKLEQIRMRCGHTNE